MKFLNSGNVVRVALDQIDVGSRLRAVSETKVAGFVVMAKDVGILSPILLRKVDDRYVLIDGAHRIEVARQRNEPSIAALLIECRTDEARSLEAGANLTSGMTPVQTAIFAASWKRDYYAQYPERAKGLFVGNQHSKKEPSDIVSVTRMLAATFGKTERHAFRILAAGEAITVEEGAALDASGQAVSMEDLTVIGKIKDGDERARVVAMLAAGKAKSAGKARRMIAAEADGSAAIIPRSDNDKAFIALMTAWDRAPMAAKKLFLAEHVDAIRPLLDRVQYDF